MWANCRIRLRRRRGGVRGPILSYTPPSHSRLLLPLYQAAAAVAREEKKGRKCGVFLARHQFTE